MRNTSRIVAVFLQERVGHAIDQGCRRIVGDEAHCQFLRNEVRRIWIVRQQVQHFQSFFFAMFFDAMPEDDLGAGLVHARLEAEGAALFRLIEGPSGEDFGNFGDIFLRVAAVYAERVQLHQFAAVVFVQAAGLPGFVASRPL